MGPPSYMRFVVDRNVVMLHIPVLHSGFFLCSMLCGLIIYVQIFKKKSSKYNWVYECIMITLQTQAGFDFSCCHLQGFENKNTFTTNACSSYTLIIIVLFFSTPWRWPHEWSKHVGDYWLIKLSSCTPVHLLVFYNKNYSAVVGVGARWCP